MKDYRVYLRDYNLSDDEYDAIMDDLLNEIAYQTNIWKKEFWFDAVDGQDYYDLNALLMMYEHDEYSTITDTAPDDYDSDTKDYSKSIANILDVRLHSYFRENSKEPKINPINTSSIGSDFVYENRFSLRYVGEPLKNFNYKRYFTIVSIVPEKEQILEAKETIVTKCFISGLQYKTALLYPDRIDMNFIQFLKRNYEFELNKLIDTEPNIQQWQNKYINKGKFI